MKPQNVSIQIFAQIHIYFHLNVLWHSLASVVTILEFPTYRIPKKYWYSIFKDFYWAQIDWMKVKITTTSYITLYEVGIDEEVKMYCSLCHFGLFLQIQATWILPGFPTWNSDSDGCSIAHSRVRGWRTFSELVTYYYYYLRKHTQIFWGILLELCHELHSYTSIPTAENEKFSTCSWGFTHLFSPYVKIICFQHEWVFSSLESKGQRMSLTAQTVKPTEAMWSDWFSKRSN